MLAPVMPLPIMTTSALGGRFLVDRWPRSNGEASVCQKELVELGTGSPAGCPSLGRSGIVRAMVSEGIDFTDTRLFENTDTLRLRVGRAGIEYSMDRYL